MTDRRSTGLLLALLLAGMASRALAQQREVTGNLARICAAGSTAAWLEVRGGAPFRMRASEFFPAFKGDLGLGPYDSMALRRVTADDLGYAHYRYDQYHRGIPVPGGSYILHERNGAVVRGNGNIITGVDPPMAGIMPRELAIREAAAAVKRRGYEPANDLAADSNGVLVIIGGADRASSRGREWRLAYRFHAYARDSAWSDYIYIDAVGGRPARFGSTWMYCTASSAPTYFYGTQQIHTMYDPAVDGWVLRNECAGDGSGVVQTHFFNEDRVATAYISPTSDWSGYTFTAGPTAQWAGEKVLEYWWTTFARRSYDDGNAALTLILRSPVIMGWNLDWHYISIEGGGSDDQWSKATLDIIGHEFTHGIEQAETGWLPDDVEMETSALYESYADIFGTMVEYYAGYGDYDIGAASGTVTRRMSNPHSISHPDTYSGLDPYWNADPATGDSHAMAEVPNYSFYLLAEGGGGTNANGVSYAVTGIGRAKAARIAYRAMVTYLTTGSTFKDARIATIRAARDLYGDCSFEQLQAARAWEAVGVLADARTSFQVCALIFSGVTDIFEGYSTIYGGGCPAPSVSACTISAGADVTFRAGDSVVLRPGFHAVEGSTFHGYIDCSAGLLKVATMAPPMRDPAGSADSAGAPSLWTFPNPAGSRVRISYRVAEPGPVHVAIYDGLGREVERIAEESYQETGLYTRDFIGGNLPAGVYWVRMVTRGAIAIDRFVVVR